MLMNLCQTEKARYYERVIQKLQNELGLQISSFPVLNIYPVEEGYSEGEDTTTYYNVDHISKEDFATEKTQITTY